jgi:hypothetical protein
LGKLGIKNKSAKNDYSKWFSVSYCAS